MASSRRVTYSVSGVLFTAIRTPYVCRTCRNHIEINARRIQNAGSRSSIRPAQSVVFTAGFRTSTTNKYASPASQQYITPDREQPTDGLEELADLEEYEEAESWEGMETIGRPAHWKEEAAKKGDEYKPFFLASPKVTNFQDHFSKWLYVALLDTFAGKALGLNFNVYNVRVRRAAFAMDLATSENGRVLGFDEKTKTLRDSIGEDESPSLSRLTTILDDNQSKISSFLANARLDFKDPTTFQILKRFSLLSRHRIPDPVLSLTWNNSRTLLDFVQLLSQHYSRAQRRSTAEVIKQTQEQFANGETVVGDTRKAKVEPLGPNVAVFSRRETPIDKEKEVGRWKVIVRELQKRNLPVTGRGVA